MNNQQVAYAWWAGQEVFAKRGPLSFSKETIYSFGAWFPCAQKVKTPAGMFVLLSDARLTPSTDGHMLCVQHAIAQGGCAGVIRMDLTRDSLFFSGSTPDHGAELRGMLLQRIRVAENILQSAGKPRIRAKTRDKILAAFHREAENIRLLLRMSAALGLPMPEPARLSEWEHAARGGRAALEAVIEKTRADLAETIEKIQSAGKIEPKKGE